MSKCISSRGEYSEHTLGSGEFEFTCTDCWTLDEEAVHEALGVARSAVYLLRKVVDYWDGRPTTMHGDEIYADLLDILKAITPEATS